MGLALRPGFLHGSVGKEAACSAGDAGDSAPGSGRSPGVGNGNPLKNICLENLVDRGAWRAAGHWVARSWARLSAQHCTQLCGSFSLHPQNRPVRLTESLSLFQRQGNRVSERASHFLRPHNWPRVVSIKKKRKVILNKHKE